MNRPPKDRALQRLQKALDAISELREIEHGSKEFTKWRRDTQVAITNTFGDNTNHIVDFNRIEYSLSFFTTGTPDRAFQEAYLDGLESAASVLESMIDEVKEYWEETEASAASSISQGKPTTITNDVFVIHGREAGAKETVARFLQILGLNPVVLHEQPNQGRTIIEKFEQHVQAAFAIALLTPDDVGALATEPKNLHFRARQNVIFEFGYFVGCLGRERVCAIVGDRVELPSDYDGVLYIELDESGAWKMELVREMKAAGLDVDANRAL